MFIFRKVQEHFVATADEARIEIETTLSGLENDLRTIKVLAKKLERPCKTMYDSTVNTKNDIKKLKDDVPKKPKHSPPQNKDDKEIQDVEMEGYNAQMKQRKLLIDGMGEGIKLIEETLVLIKEDVFDFSSKTVNNNFKILQLLRKVILVNAYYRWYRLSLDRERYAALQAAKYQRDMAAYNQQLARYQSDIQQYRQQANPTGPAPQQPVQPQRPQPLPPYTGPPITELSLQIPILQFNRRIIRASQIYRFYLKNAIYFKYYVELATITLASAKTELSKASNPS